MGRRPRAEAGGVQGFPLTAGAEHKQNRLHTNAIRRARFTAAETVRVHMFGDQQGDGLPQVLSNAPIVNYPQLVHVATSVEYAAAKEYQPTSPTSARSGFPETIPSPTV